MDGWVGGSVNRWRDGCMADGCAAGWVGVDGLMNR